MYFSTVGLAAVWLWSDRAGVFSHEMALSLHGRSDVLPARVHLTVPSDWSRRRLQVPEGVKLAYAEVPKAELARLTRPGRAAAGRAS